MACGRRWGKTTLTVNQLIFEALANQKGGEYWYIAPTYKQAKNIAWRMLKDQWKFLPRSLIGNRNEAELSVEVANSKIILKGADNEDSLRGSGLYGLILDECASFKNFNYLWENVLRPALSDYRGFAWFISTPKGFNHFYDLFNQQDNDKDYRSFSFTSYDNPHLALEEIEKAKQELSEDAFAQEYLADFRKHTGLIYKGFDRNIHVIEPIYLPEFWQFYRAMDFGAENPTVCLFIAVDMNGNMYVFDEYYQSMRTTQFHAETILAKSRLQKKDFQITWGDPSAEQERIDYSQFNLPITSALVFGKVDGGWVKSGIEKVSAALKINPLTNKPKLFIFKNCKYTIREFEAYHWLELKESSQDKEIPFKKNDHCMDALRYFIGSYSQTYKEDKEIIFNEEANKFTGY